MRLEKKPTLQELINDVNNEYRQKEFTIENGNTFYGNKTRGVLTKDQKNGNNSKGFIKSKKCKGYDQPNPKHLPEQCFTTNKKLRDKWEKKNKKKWVMWDKYKENNKDSDINTNNNGKVKGKKKKKDNNSDNKSHFSFNGLYSAIDFSTDYTAIYGPPPP